MEILNAKFSLCWGQWSIRRWAEGVGVGGLEGLVLRQHQDSSHQPLPMMDGSQMPVKLFFSSIANDRVMCLDLKDLQVLLSKQWGTWLICSAGEKLTPRDPGLVAELPPAQYPLCSATSCCASGRGWVEQTHAVSQCFQWQENIADERCVQNSLSAVSGEALSRRPGAEPRFVCVGGSVPTMGKGVVRH